MRKTILFLFLLGTILLIQLKSISAATWPEIKVKAALGSLSTSTSVKFGNTMKLGLDFGYDAGIMKSGFDVYTRLVEDNGVDFGIQCLPMPANVEMIVPVGIESSTGGTLTLSAELNNLPTTCQLVFEDRVLGTFKTITANETLTTLNVLAKSKITDRFYLRITFIVSVAKTLSITSVTTTNAVVNCAIEAGTAKARGVVYSTLPNPDFSANKRIEQGQFDKGNYALALSGLASGTTYYVRSFMVTATDTIWGNEISFSTNAKTLLIVTVQNQSKIYGEENPVLTCNYSGFINGDNENVLDVKPGFTTSATKKSNAGSYGIAVSGGYDNNYEFSYRSGELTIAKAKLTATVSNVSSRVGVIPDFTVTYSGFVNGDSITKLDQLPVATTTANTSSLPGDYPIAVSGGADDNYEFVYGTGTLSLIPKTVPTIKWDKPTSINYGTPLVKEQLNASASIPGKFNYTPSEGTVLVAGYGQKIKVEFTPDDLVNLSTVTDSVTIDVVKALLTVKADDQTITYGQALPELTYSFTGFVNGESLASGIPSGLKIIVDSVESLSAGTYVIRATGGVADNYTIHYIDGQLRVKKAELKVTAFNQEMYIGNQIPTISLAYSGFVNNETIADLDSLPIAYHEVEDASEAGIYPIKVAKGFDNNYDYKYFEGILTIKKKPIPVVSWPTPNDIVYGTLLSSTQLNANASVDGMFDYSPSLGTLLKSGLSQPLKVHFTPKSDTIAAVDTFVFLNVLKKELTVTADNKDRLYGNENPAFTFAYSGFINGENESSLDSKPVIRSLASAKSDAGDYSIVLDGGADKNYQFNYKNGVLSIQKAKLTVQANTVSTPVGTIPQLSVSYSGFKNNDDETVIDVQPIPFTTATAKSPTGIYSIHVANGIDNNYDFIYIEGELIINDKQTPELIWEAPSPITYGQLLDETQLNATANVSGKLIYSPENGTLLKAGFSQKLEVEFIPTDTINYNKVHKSVLIDVQKAHLSVKAENQKIVQGEAIPALTYSIDGFVNGEDQGKLLTLPMPITAATIQSLPGKYPITFTSGTDNNYEFTYIEGELIITEKQTPTLNWNTPAPINYGNLLTEKQLNATSTVSGKFIYTPAVGTLLKAGKAQKLEVAFFPDDSINYDSVSKSVVIDVDRALLRVTANDQTIVYGEPIPELTYTTEGFVNGESLSTLIFELNSGNNSGMPAPLTTLPTAKLGNGQGIDAETYTITVSGGSAANYNFAYSQGKLTVEKALLTVQVANGQMVVGTDVPKLGITLSGFHYSDNEKDIDTMPKVVTSVSSSTTVGEYELIADGGADNNYKFTYKSGLLKIVPKQIPMVSWKNPDAIVYGTQLSSVQLNATSNIEGKFVYTPSAGTLLGAGEIQALTVIFTPNSAAYEMVSDTVFITIEKKNLMVSAQNQTIEEGNPLPNFTLYYDGFVNGDNESNLDQLPVASTTATAQSEAGDYPIILEAGTDDNYNFLYTNGLLTIQKKNGIVDLNNHFLNVFQNTTNRSIIIENTSTLEGTYLLIDLNGRKIASGKVHCGKNTLQTPSIGNGLFLLQLQIGKVSRMFKVVY